MDFKQPFLKTALIPFLLAVIVLGVVLWGSIKPESSIDPIRDASVKPVVQDQSLQDDLSKEPGQSMPQQEDVTIAQQLDHDRQEQKETKYLKTKLEQTNLELEQEKALAEINKLKMENVGSFKEPVIDGQKNIPEVRVQYIGGDAVKKEAILSIAGVSFQVKEKSVPIDNIQVVSISDSSVTVHFSAPQELTKIIDYKPE